MKKAGTGLVALLGVVAGVCPAAAWPGCESDLLGAEIVGDTLTVHHRDAAYNCCMDSTTYTVTMDGSVIDIIETEIVPDPCLCLCCFDLSVSVADLAPGTWTVVFRWHDSDSDQWEEWSDDVTVPDVGQGGEAVVSGVMNSGCIDPNAAPLRPGAVASWGRVKSIYR